MKNPFKKEDNTKLIAAIAIASLTAGAVAFFYLTGKGKETRKDLKKKIKSITKDAIADAIRKKIKVNKKAVKPVADQISA
jgi:hypothetical protein